MVPKNKNDFAAIEELENADLKEVAKFLPQLIPWLADCNWPIFKRLCVRISHLGDQLIPELNKAFSDNDTILKCNIVGHLFPLLNDDQLKSYRAELTNICMEAKMEDVIEGLVDYAEIQLSRLGQDT